MTPEKARQLRDVGRLRRRPAFAPQPGTRKHRELRFDRLHGESQVEKARRLLSGLEGIDVDAGLTPHSISLWYEVTDYTFEGLEGALRSQGFHLDNSFTQRLVRAFVYYCEETQLRNMRVPERLIKKSHDIYSKAWEHHPHGDHDDTPPELRQDR